MYDPMAMNKGDRFEDIAQDLNNLLLLELLLLPDEFEEVISGAVLHDEVDLLLVVEVAVEFDDVGVAQVHLDLHLPHEGDLQVLLLDDLLGDGLDGADEAGVPVACDVDLPVLAGADLHAQLELLEADDSLLLELVVLLLVVLELLGEVGGADVGGDAAVEALLVELLQKVVVLPRVVGRAVDMHALLHVFVLVLAPQLVGPARWAGIPLQFQRGHHVLLQAAFIVVVAEILSVELEAVLETRLGRYADGALLGLVSVFGFFSEEGGVLDAVFDDEGTIGFGEKGRHHGVVLLPGEGGFGAVVRVVVGGVGPFAEEEGVDFEGLVGGRLEKGAGDYLPDGFVHFYEVLAGGAEGVVLQHVGEGVLLVLERLFIARVGHVFASPALLQFPDLLKTGRLLLVPPSRAALAR